MKNNAMLVLFLFNITDIFASSTPEPGGYSTQIKSVFRSTPAAIEGIRPPAKGFYVFPVACVDKNLLDQESNYMLLNPKIGNKREQFKQLELRGNIKTGLYQIRWEENGRDKEDWFTIEQQHLGGFVLRFVQIDGIWRVKITTAKKTDPLHSV